MKLKDFIIGIGVFGIFTLIIFSMINPENPEGIYGENYLNITTMDDETKETIVAFADMGDNATKDYGIVGGEIEEFTTNRSRGEVATEGNLLNEGIKILFAVPRFFRTIGSGLGQIGASIGIPNIFLNWAVVAITVIIVLMIASAFLRNKLQD